jgi:predicted ATP-dependent endonuclease of OLD family
MRLKAFQIKNYKTIKDSGVVEADSNVTCLMGKNEAGKSGVMQALWKFNNVAGANYDRLFDLPAEDFTKLRTKDPEVAVLCARGAIAASQALCVSASSVES